MTFRSPVTRRAALLTTAAAATAARSRDLLAGEAPQRPNILFIMADDLGYGDLSCYGHPTIKTPRLDQLAGRGVRFTQSYANSPVCSATRTAPITGRYQYRLRLGLEEPLLNPREDVGLPADIPTLPLILKNAGYATMLIGKWHLGMLPNYGSHQNGYERFYGVRGGAVDYSRISPRRANPISGTTTRPRLKPATSPISWRSVLSRRLMATPKARSRFSSACT